MFLFCTVESIELLLQIIVEESRSALTAGLEEDTAAWVRGYIDKHTGMQKHTDKHVVIFMLCYKVLTPSFFQMEPYLQKAPGFSRLLGVWSR